MYPSYSFVSDIDLIIVFIYMRQHLPPQLSTKTPKLVVCILYSVYATQPRSAATTSVTVNARKLIINIIYIAFQWESAGPGMDIFFSLELFWSQEDEKKTLPTWLTMPAISGEYYTSYQFCHQIIYFLNKLFQSLIIRRCLSPGIPHVSTPQPWVASPVPACTIVPPPTIWARTVRFSHPKTTLKCIGSFLFLALVQNINIKCTLK